MKQENQLRGRSGRQGDPGTSRFFVSLEDEVIKLYGGSSIEKISNKVKHEEGKPLESKNLLKMVERAQRGIEGRNFEIRKNVIQYDDVINEQRKIIYAERNRVLDNESVEEEIQKMVKDVISETANKYLVNKDYYGYLISLYNKFMPENTLLIPGIDKMSIDEVIEYTYDLSKRVYDFKKIVSGIEELRNLEVVDSYWIDHIDTMDQLRQCIGLSAIGQKDPVKEYTIQGYELFEELNETIRTETVKYLYKFN